MPSCVMVEPETYARLLLPLEQKGWSHRVSHLPISQGLHPLPKNSHWTRRPGVSSAWRAKSQAAILSAWFCATVIFTGPKRVLTDLRGQAQFMYTRRRGRLAWRPALALLAFTTLLRMMGRWT